jgi:hypothetical protein
LLPLSATGIPEAWEIALPVCSVIEGRSRVWAAKAQKATAACFCMQNVRCAFSFPGCDSQAQGLVRLFGGVEAVRGCVLHHSIVLAAHGVYTAAGASEVLGLPVDCISKDSSSFAGLVTALERRLEHSMHVDTS